MRAKSRALDVVVKVEVDVGVEAVEAVDAVELEGEREGEGGDVGVAGTDDALSVGEGGMVVVVV